MKRFLQSPVHICLVGALVLSLGVAAAVEIVASLMIGEPTFNLGFLLIMPGLGVLRGSAVHRSFFGGLLALAIVGLALAFLAKLGAGFFPPEEWHGLQIITIGLLGLIISYGFVVLWDARNDEWFSEKFGRKPPPYVVPVVVLTLLWSGGMEVADYRREQLWKDIYCYDVEVTARDAETGELIRYPSMVHPDHNLGDAGVPGWFRRSGGGGGAEGTISIQGYARGDTSFKISHEGYEAETVDLNRETGPSVEVMLKPIPK